MHGPSYDNKMAALQNGGQSPPAKKAKSTNNMYPSNKPDNTDASGDICDASTATNSAQQLEQQRRTLPVWRQRNKLCAQIRAHCTCIVIGETGSGKSTQLPQLCIGEASDIGGPRAVAVTQPRRMAAISLARRVSDEMACTLGTRVGYSVRFEQCCSDQTRLHYVTDGMLLRESMHDRHLLRYTCIILDEAHERTIHTDILFGVLKKIQKLRRFKELPELRLIIMSATMDVDNFSRYFNNAPVVYLRGRQFPVQVFYCRERHEDPVFSCLAAAIQIHRSAPVNRDILMFLTGQEEIDTMVTNLRQVAKQLGGSSPHLHVLPLYAALPLAQQLAVFAPRPRGHRRLVVATNIAETSLTLPDVGYVIDGGLVKRRDYQASTGLEVLRVEPISQAQAWQRTGRAGRVSAGFCYRIYTRKEFDDMGRDSVPDIRRCNMASACLQLLAVGVKNVAGFDFIDKPDSQTVDAAVAELQHLSAVTVSGDEAFLTTIGQSMSSFPLDPKFSRAILASKEYNCTEEVVTIVAMMSVENILLSPASRRQEIHDVRQKFVAPEGDMITLLNVYRAYKKVNRNKEWCDENGLHVRHLAQAENIRRQLLELCRRRGLSLGSSGGAVGGSQGREPILRALSAGLFQNTAQMNKLGHLMTISGGHRVQIHPSSSLFLSRPSCVMFTELIVTTQKYIRCVSVVQPQWLSQAAPHFFSKHRLYMDS